MLLLSLSSSCSFRSKSQTKSQKAKLRSKAKDREASLAEAFDEPTRPPSDTIEQIRLEQLKGANLDKQLELTKIKAELARMQVDSGQPLLGSSTPKHIKQTTSTSRPKFMEDCTAVPTLSQLRSTEKASEKGMFMPNTYLFSTKGVPSYDNLNISEFVCGFLELVKTSPEVLREQLIEYLHVLMEKAIHYKWPAVRNFHAAICNTVDSKRLSWDDLAEIRLKSVTHFSHADLRVQNSMEAKSVSRNSKYTGQPKEVRNGYCEPWNDFNNCTCSPSDPKYKDTQLCKICDNDHSKLSCPKVI